MVAVQNPALKLPPGHSDGYNAPPDLIETAASTLLHIYAGVANCRNQDIATMYDNTHYTESKRWSIWPNGSLGPDLIAEALTTGRVCYSITHKKYCKSLVFDVDEPRAVAELLESALRGQGWVFKKFHSGRGRHYWVFFDDLPPDLLGTYNNSGPSAMVALGEAFLAYYKNSLENSVELKCCNGQFLKLPLQYDPYHKWIVMPFDENDQLIDEYEQAVKYAAEIHLNDSSGLRDWILKAWNHPRVAEIVSQQSSGIRLAMGDDIQLYKGDLKQFFRSYRIGEGESYQKVGNMVWRCFVDGVSESEVMGLIERKYRSGRKNGTVTCKDKLVDWQSKARASIKRIYTKYSPPGSFDEVAFYKSDLEWLALNTKKPTDRVCLAIHLLFWRLNEEKDYFLSRNFAVKLGSEWGLTDQRFRGAKERFETAKLIKVVKPGFKGPALPGVRRPATTYRVKNGPPSTGDRLKVTSIREFLSFAMSCYN